MKLLDIRNKKYIFFYFLREKIAQGANIEL